MYQEPLQKLALAMPILTFRKTLLMSNDDDDDNDDDEKSFEGDSIVQK